MISPQELYQPILKQKKGKANSFQRLRNNKSTVTSSVFKRKFDDQGSGLQIQSSQGLEARNCQSVQSVLSKTPALPLPSLNRSVLDTFHKSDLSQNRLSPTSFEILNLPSIGVRHSKSPLFRRYHLNGVANHPVFPSAYLSQQRNKALEQPKLPSLVIQKGYRMQMSKPQVHRFNIKNSADLADHIRVSAHLFKDPMSNASTPDQDRRGGLSPQLRRRGITVTQTSSPREQLSPITATKKHLYAKPTMQSIETGQQDLELHTQFRDLNLDHFKALPRHLYPSKMQPISSLSRNLKTQRPLPMPIEISPSQSSAHLQMSVVLPLFEKKDQGTQSIALNTTAYNFDWEQL